MMKGKHIILGICGGIAAYKSVYLLRLLVKAGAEVQVVITPAGKEFITPVTLSSLSGKPVISEFFTANTGSWNSHVDLGLWADAMIIAPATESTIGKMANGIADTPATFACKAHLRNARPVLLAISTNDGLSASAENIGRLLNRKHYYFVPFGQDSPQGKPYSLVADLSLLPLAAEAALLGQQLQPILRQG